jgi:hypothetical protein
VTMECIRVFLEYLRVLAWPIVALSVALSYRSVVARLLPGAAIELRLFNVTLKTSLPEIQKALTESLDGDLSSEQWKWLEKLEDQCRIELTGENRTDVIRLLRPIRNSGLIRTYPRGSFLEAGSPEKEASAVEITSLGRMLLEARKGR